MRVATKNKQKMWYSNITGITEEYERDENGDIKYIEVDGERIPVSTGTTKPLYGKPIAFSASISSKLNELQMRAWGVDQSAIFSQVDVPKGYLPIDIGTVVWREHNIEWDDKENGIPKPSSADYTCKGLMTEGLHEDLYLLQRNSSEGDT